MNFLFPFFALAAMAVAIPILLHFRRQPPQKEVPFSSLMFLEQTPVPPKTRRKLEDWLLLLLRCLALILLALMFGRPFLRSAKATPGEGGVNWCILVDTSASMQREDVWDQVEEKYAAALQKVGEADTLCVVAYDQSPRLLLDHETWTKAPQGTRHIAASGVLQDVEPGWGGTDLGQALIFAAQELSGDGKQARERRIVLISDMQEGSALEALHAASWPEDVAVTVDAVEAPWKNNFTLSPAPAVTVEEAASIASSLQGANATSVGQVRVRVNSTRESEAEKFTLQWNTGTGTGAAGENLEATVPPGGTRILTAPARPETSGGDARLDLRGDAMDFDNHLYVAKPMAREVRILCLGKGLSRTETDSPLFYMARALKPTPALTPLLVEKDPAQLQATDLADADVVLIFGTGPEAGAKLLRTWVEGGGALVTVADGGKGDGGELWRALGGDAGLKVTEATKDALLQDLDFSHPLLQAFAESGVRDFTKIRYWKHRVLEGIGKMEQATVIARFDDGSPAWMEWPLAKGKVLAMTAGWQPSDSQLAVSSKFVPLLYSLVDWSQGRAGSAQSLVVGEPIVAQAAWEGTVSVKRPDGKTDSWNVDQTSQYERTDTPGIYVLGIGSETRSVAVNLWPNEGRLAPLDLQRLSETGVKLAQAAKAGTATGEEAAKAERRMEDSEHEQRQKGWKFLLLAALVVLLLETWLAGRRSKLAPAAQTPQPA